MLSRETIESLNRSALIEVILQQQEQFATGATLVTQQKQIDQLLGRSSRSERRKQKKRDGDGKPGRKKGEGPFSRRSSPPPEDYTTQERVAVKETACPECSGALQADGYETVTTTDIPRQQKPIVKAYHIAMCRCGSCGKRVRAQHPDVAEDQRGATAHRLGQNILAVAWWLHYELGLPFRKLPVLLKQLYGLKVTQSALTQSALKAAEGSLSQQYAGLREDIVGSTVVHTDDTGWSIKGVQAWLMVFSSAKTLYYQIRKRHRNEEVREVLAEEFGGVLVTDRFSSYDATSLSGIAQQKCMAHILRNIKDHLIDQPLVARSYPRRLLETFKEAVALHGDFIAGRVDAERYTKESGRLLDRLDRLLSPRRLQNAANARLHRGLFWHHERGSLLRFLKDPSIPSTNNEAERSLRPAVIARKVSHSSGSDRGAESHSIFSSLFGTLKRRGMDSAVDGILHLLLGNPMPEPAVL